MVRSSSGTTKAKMCAAPGKSNTGLVEPMRRSQAVVAVGEVEHVFTAPGVCESLAGGAVHGHAPNLMPHPIGRHEVGVGRLRVVSAITLLQAWAVALPCGLAQHGLGVTTASKRT